MPKFLFFRSKKLSDDYTPTYKVLIDCIKKLKSQHVPYHFCIYPTSIFTDVKDLKRAFHKIKKNKSNFICPIAKYTSPPQRSFGIKGILFITIGRNIKCLEVKIKKTCITIQVHFISIKQKLY